MSVPEAAVSGETFREGPLGPEPEAAADRERLPEPVAAVLGRGGPGRLPAEPLDGQVEPGQIERLGEVVLVLLAPERSGLLEVAARDLLSLRFGPVARGERREVDHPRAHGGV